MRRSPATPAVRFPLWLSQFCPLLSVAFPAALQPSLLLIFSNVFTIAVNCSLSCRFFLRRCFALHVMVFGRFSLILAFGFLGLQAQAVPHPQGDREQHSQHFQNTLATMASASQTLEVNESPPGGAFTSPGDGAPTPIVITSSSSPSPPETSVMPSSTPGPTVTPFESIWSVPENFSANASELIFFKVLSDPTLADGSPLDPVLFVLQTSVALPPVPNAMNSSNTWSVAQIPSMFSFPQYLSTACLTFFSYLQSRMPKYAYEPERTRSDRPHERHQYRLFVGQYCRF